MNPFGILKVDLHISMKPLCEFFVSLIYVHTDTDRDQVVSEAFSEKYELFPLFNVSLGC